SDGPERDSAAGQTSPLPWSRGIDAATVEMPNRNVLPVVELRIAHPHRFTQQRQRTLTVVSLHDPVPRSPRGLTTRRPHAHPASVPIVSLHARPVGHNPLAATSPAPSPRSRAFPQTTSSRARLPRLRPQPPQSGA